MAYVIVGMTMSLDGFVSDRRGSVGALYADFAAMHDFAPLQESIRNTGAVVMGWKTFAMADDPDSYAGNYEYQVPIFVLTHRVPKTHPQEAGARAGGGVAHRQNASALSHRQVGCRWTSTR